MQFFCAFLVLFCLIPSFKTITKNVSPTVAVFLSYRTIVVKACTVKLLPNTVKKPSQMSFWIR